tara:strand:+ start:39 stop:509 length:471 start_codon:yes stop_codon:yes gene_type:complete
MIDQLRSLLEQDEGIKHSIYLDHLDKPTTGIGHLIKVTDVEFGDPVGTSVSADRVTELFNEDVKTCISDCRQLIFDFNGMPVSAQITAASLAFQLGVNRYSKFKKHLSAMDAGDWGEAAAQLRDSKLYRQTPERTERHAKRLEAVGNDGNNKAVTT